MDGRDTCHENCFGEVYSRLICLTDAKLITGDGSAFDVHRFVLAKNSDYFLTLFCSYDKDRKEFPITDIAGEVLKDILSYFYTGDLHVTEENIYDLIMASDYLLLNDILPNIQTYLKHNLFARDCLRIYIAALRMNKECIIKEIVRLVQMHFEEVLYNEPSKIGQLPFEELQKLLSDRNLRVSNENIIWQVIVKWVDADPPKRLPRVPSLLLHLAVTDADNALVTEIMQHDIVANNEFCEAIIKSSNASNSFEKFQNYLRQHRDRDSTFQRRPSKLHFIVLYGEHDFKLYVTYDENLDVWRKVLEADNIPQCFSILKDCIYMLGTAENKNLCYNVVEERWTELTNFEYRRNIFSAVALQGRIYVLGPYSAVAGDIKYAVEFYDPSQNRWDMTLPMWPISSFSAVSMDGAIYAVGSFSEYTPTEMTAQVCDPEKSAFWYPLTGPTLTRSNFALAAYQGKLYVIGGKDRDVVFKQVEVFDPKIKVWEFVKDLPYGYDSPKAMVINDKLIVFDSYREEPAFRKRYPPVLWNASEKCWVIVDESSPMYNVHMYDIFSLESGDCFDFISKKNKEPTTIFERSPLS